MHVGSLSLIFHKSIDVALSFSFAALLISWQGPCVPAAAAVAALGEYLP